MTMIARPPKILFFIYLLTGLELIPGPFFFFSEQKELYAL